MGKKGKLYSSGFYERTKMAWKANEGSMARFLNGILAPKSVIDVGCANGELLSDFKSMGVKTVFGVDNDVPIESLVIKKEEFMKSRT